MFANKKIIEKHSESMWTTETNALFYLSGRGDGVQCVFVPSAPLMNEKVHFVICNNIVCLHPMTSMQGGGVQHRCDVVAPTSAKEERITGLRGEPKFSSYG